MPILSGPVLGIDPGTHRCGFGLVFRQGNRYVHVAHGVACAPPGAPLPERLAHIADILERVIAEHKPSAVAIEQAFVHRDVRAAMAIGHARGVAMLIAARQGLAVGEYPPATVRRVVVGSGRADKTQVARMVQALVGLAALPAHDATDALAVAICHASSLQGQAAVRAAMVSHRVGRA